jgi:uncharacterized damage-inducible protein DinB
MTTSETEGYIVCLRDLRDEMLKHIAALDPVALNWKPPAGDTNSIYVLATHVAGSERYWMQQVVGGTNIMRDRPSEFVASGADAAALVHEIEEVGRQTESLLRSLDVADLRGRRGTQPHEHSVQWCILHVIEHLSRHVGHVELTRQLWEASRQPQPHE